MNFAQRHLRSSFIALLVVCFSAHAEVTLSMATDKQEYVPGETIDFRMTAHNSDSTPVTLMFTSSPAMGYSLDSKRFVLPQTDSPLRLMQTIPGNSSFTWTMHHKWRQYVIPLGEHKVVGSLAAAGIVESAPATFRIVEPTALPTKDFTVNFDEIPGSKTPIEEIEQYWPWGVEFGLSKNTRSRLVLGKNGQDTYLACTSATIPPGFNIIANLKMPVSAVQADVSSASGRQITMIAKDEEGKVLDKAVSPTITERGKFVPLAVESKTAPIASVEWWPSFENSPVMIDNVRISPAGQ